jgi:hypothetical protein
MKSFLLLLACALVTSSAFARNPVAKECKAVAEGVAYEQFEEYIHASDFLPLVRSISSKDGRVTITHYVQVVIDGSSSITTVELEKGSCKVVRVE